MSRHGCAITQDAANLTAQKQLPGTTTPGFTLISIASAPYQPPIRAQPSNADRRLAFPEENWPDAQPSEQIS